jgi:hypothetical protein
MTTSVRTTCERGFGGLVFHLYEEISPDGGA